MGAKNSKGNVLRGSGSLPSCSVYVHEGGKGLCQDSVLAAENLLPEHKAAVLGVFDGHGHVGHSVSQFCREQVLSRLKTALEDNAAELRHRQGWEKTLDSVFVGADEALEKEPSVVSMASGSTASVAVRKGDLLVIAHIGDSRAVLGRTKTKEDGSGYQISPLSLTNDHKAGDPGEKERIHKAGGRVVRWMNTIDRLFVPGKNEPGLAVSRAFGDFDLKGHGLIANPVVRVHDIAPADEFVVICSDGVWDMLSNEEVVQLVWDTKSRAKAARAVAMKAAGKWNNEKSPNVRDDIAVVIYYF